MQVKHILHSSNISSLKEDSTTRWLNLGNGTATFKFTKAIHLQRWGDAPVHSIAASLFARKDQTHFFKDIGYRHPPFQHCPQGNDWVKGRCACNPSDSFGACFPRTRSEKLHWLGPWRDQQTIRTTHVHADMRLFSNRVILRFSMYYYWIPRTQSASYSAVPQNNI